MGSRYRKHVPNNSRHHHFDGNVQKGKSTSNSRVSSKPDEPPLPSRVNFKSKAPTGLNDTKEFLNDAKYNSFKDRYNRKTGANSTRLPHEQARTHHVPHHSVPDRKPAMGSEGCAHISNDDLMRLLLEKLRNGSLRYLNPENLLELCRLFEFLSLNDSTFQLLWEATRRMTAIPEVHSYAVEMDICEETGPDEPAYRQETFPDEMDIDEEVGPETPIGQGQFREPMDDCQPDDQKATEAMGLDTEAEPPHGGLPPSNPSVSTPSAPSAPSTPVRRDDQLRFECQRCKTRSASREDCTVCGTRMTPEKIVLKCPGPKCRLSFKPNLWHVFEEKVKSVFELDHITCPHCSLNY